MTPHILKHATHDVLVKEIQRLDEECGQSALDNDEMANELNKTRLSNCWYRGEIRHLKAINKELGEQLAASIAERIAKVLGNKQ